MQRSLSIDLLYHRLLLSIYWREQGTFTRLLSELKTLLADEEAYHTKLIALQHFAEWRGYTDMWEEYEHSLSAALEGKQKQNIEAHVSHSILVLSRLQLVMQLQFMECAFGDVVELSRDEQETLQVIGITTEDKTREQIQDSCKEVLTHLLETNALAGLQLISVYTNQNELSFLTKLSVVEFITNKFSVDYFVRTQNASMLELFKQTFIAYLGKHEEFGLPRKLATSVVKTLLKFNMPFLAEHFSNHQECFNQLYHSLRRIGWKPYTLMFHFFKNEQLSLFGRFESLLPNSLQLEAKKYLCIAAALEGDYFLQYKVRAHADNAVSPKELESFGSPQLEQSIAAMFNGKDTSTQAIKQMISVDIPKRFPAMKRFAPSNFGLICHFKNVSADESLRDKIEHISRNYMSLLGNEFTFLQARANELRLILQNRTINQEQKNHVRIMSLIIMFFLTGFAFLVVTQAACAGKEICKDESNNLIDCNTDIMNTNHTEITTYAASPWCYHPKRSVTVERSGQKNADAGTSIDVVLAAATIGICSFYPIICVISAILEINKVSRNLQYDYALLSSTVKQNQFREKYNAFFAEYTQFHHLLQFLNLPLPTMNELATPLTTENIQQVERALQEYTSLMTAEEFSTQLNKATKIRVQGMGWLRIDENKQMLSHLSLFQSPSLLIQSSDDNDASFNTNRANENTYLLSRV